MDSYTKAEDIKVLYTDWPDCDDGSVTEYRWLCRWTAKSLIITAMPGDENIPAAWRVEKHVVPRKKAETQLMADGTLYHKRGYYQVRPYAERMAEFEERQRKRKEMEARQDAMYALIDDERKGLIEQYAEWKDINLFTTGDRLCVDQMIDADGGDEVVRARIAGRKYRSIDAV